MLADLGYVAFAADLYGEVATSREQAMALLTGLVAQISPVQARIGAAAGAEVAVQLPSISRRAPVVSQIASRPASDSVWRILPIEALAPQRAAPIPTVLTGIDRARE